MGEMEKSAQTNMEYLQDILTELLEDENWELPREARFFLLPGCELEILYL